MTIVQDFVIPAREGRLFTVAKGQRLRVITQEGPQAADLIAFNADDLRETLSSCLTRQMSGNFTTARDIYTKLPAGRIMFRVLSAPPGCFWLAPGRCNRIKHNDPTAESCQDILTACVKELGMDGFDVPEVLNLFMNPQMHTDGTYEFLPSPVEPGDYVEMIAEMSSIVAISACPDHGGYNLGYPKSLAVQVLDERSSANSICVPHGVRK